MTVFETLAAVPVLPVLTFDDASDPVAVCTALRDGGLRAVEITLRTPAGAASIERVTKETDLLVGAGTVLTEAEVRKVADLGARFVVSPGFDDDVIAMSREVGIPALPGVATATEAQRALRHGLDHVKVFPAASLGGPDFLRQLLAPFPTLRLMPSGGISLETVRDYLAVPGVFAVAGSWMVPRRSGERWDPGAIRALAAETLTRIGGA